jgi:hypothetical protein
MAKTIIHINQHRIKKNRKTGSRDPVVTCKTYRENRYGHEAVIRDKDGNEVARVVYRPDAPLNCGAVCWVETRLNVDVVDKEACCAVAD